LGLGTTCNDTQTGNALAASQPALPDSNYDFRNYNERPGFVQRLELIGQLLIAESSVKRFGCGYAALC
jgi:hypothetical protein